MQRIRTWFALTAWMLLVLGGCAPDETIAPHMLQMGRRGNEARVTVAGEHVAIDGLDGRFAFRLRTARLGRLGAEDAMPRVHGSRANGQEVVLDRDGIEERYLAGAAGLEQSYRIEARPDGAGDLAIEVRFEGVRPEDGPIAAGAVQLRDGEGLAVALYRDLAAFDASGRTLGARMQVAGDAVKLVIDDREAVYPVAVDPMVVALQTVLTANDGEPYDSFGASVGISGDTILAGASQKNLGRGAAYVFGRSGTVWSQTAELISDAPGTAFGRSAAISGNTAVVGRCIDGCKRGAAHIFVRDGTSWSEQAVVSASEDVDHYDFGGVVGISGDTVIASARSNTLNTGAAYVFARSGATWSQQAKLTAAGQSSRFGDALGVSGDTAIVGDWLQEYETGAAYVFVRGGSTWSLQAKLSASDAQHYARFGYGVSISGDTALVGSYSGQGAPAAAYIFVRNGAVWSEQARLTPSGPGYQEDFGKPVSISDDMAVVGWSHDSAGVACVFARSGSAWFEQPKLHGDPNVMHEYFGNPLAVESNTVVVGASHNASSTGAVYVFATSGANVGEPCAAGVECASTFCVDGVCCESACGGSTSDCEACSTAAGAAVDGVCMVVPNGSACSDDDACTQSDVCQSGICVGANTVQCTAQDQCHDQGSCGPPAGVCSSPAKPDGSGCDDGNPATVDDVCFTGVCSGIDHCAGVMCTPQDGCHDAVCHHATGICLRSVKSDGTPCDDGICGAGVCVPNDAGTDAEAGDDDASDAQESGADVGKDAEPRDAQSSDAVRADSSSDATTPGTDTLASGRGCGCRAVSARRHGAVWLAILGIGLFIARRRHRRSAVAAPARRADDAPTARTASRNPA